jgi:hypothetical protein
VLPGLRRAAFAQWAKPRKQEALVFKVFARSVIDNMTVPAEDVTDTAIF